MLRNLTIEEMALVSGGVNDGPMPPGPSSLPTPDEINDPWRSPIGTPQDSVGTLPCQSEDDEWQAATKKREDAQNDLFMMFASSGAVREGALIDESIAQGRFANCAADNHGYQ